jgi:hypothetical protein
MNIMPAVLIDASAIFAAQLLACGLDMLIDSHRASGLLPT